MSGIGKARGNGIYSSYKMCSTEGSNGSTVHAIEIFLAFRKHFLEESYSETPNERCSIIHIVIVVIDNTANI